MAWESVVSTEGGRLASLEQKSAVIRLVLSAGSLIPEESSSRQNTGERGGVVQVRGDGAWPMRYLPKSRGSVCDRAPSRASTNSRITEKPKNLLLFCCPVLTVILSPCAAGLQPLSGWFAGAPHTLWTFQSPPPPSLPVV